MVKQLKKSKYSHLEDSEKFQKKEKAHVEKSQWQLLDTMPSIVQAPDRDDNHESKL